MYCITMAFRGDFYSGSGASAYAGAERLVRFTAFIIFFVAAWSLCSSCCAQGEGGSSGGTTSRQAVGMDRNQTDGMLVKDFRCTSGARFLFVIAAAGSPGTGYVAHDDIGRADGSADLHCSPSASARTSTSSTWTSVAIHNAAERHEDEHRWYLSDSDGGHDHLPLRCWSFYGQFLMYKSRIRAGHYEIVHQRHWYDLTRRQSIDFRC